MAAKPVRIRPANELIELDTLLDGNPTWEQVVEFWKKGEFHEEKYLLDAIKRHLRTPEQKKQLDEMDLTIADCLNGRYTGEHEKAVHKIYAAWNEKLGFKHFGG